MQRRLCMNTLHVTYHFEIKHVAEVNNEASYAWLC